MSRLLALAIREGAILEVDTATGAVGDFYRDAGPCPDGVVVVADQVVWTSMGTPVQRPELGAGEAGLDYTARDGGVHRIGLDGTAPADLTSPGTVTTGKQICSDGERLYWGDREGHRVSSCRLDGSDRRDVVVNEPGDDWNDACVGVCVTDGYLYWTQKGPSKGGSGRILRTLLAPALAGRSPVRSDAVETVWHDLPEPIDLDAHEGYLYWTDRGAAPAGNTLNRSPLPPAGQVGGPVEILADGFQEAIGLAIDAEHGVVYVSDLAGSIHTVPVPNTEGSTPGTSSHWHVRHPLTGLALRP